MWIKRVQIETTASNQYWIPIDYRIPFPHSRFLPSERRFRADVRCQQRPPPEEKDHRLSRGNCANLIHVSATPTTFELIRSHDSDHKYDEMYHNFPIQVSHVLDISDARMGEWLLHFLNSITIIPSLTLSGCHFTPSVWVHAALFRWVWFSNCKH